MLASQDNLTMPASHRSYLMDEACGVVERLSISVAFDRDVVMDYLLRTYENLDFGVYGQPKVVRGCPKGCQKGCPICGAPFPTTV
jgi:hypothetical protein